MFETGTIGRCLVWKLKWGGPCPPLAHGGYAPAFKGLSVVSNCLRPESEPLMSETKVDKLACKHRYTHTHYMKLYIYVFDLY